MEKIVLYGAGKMGRERYEFLKENQWDHYIYGFCDRNAAQIQSIDNKPVWTFEKLKKDREILFCINASKEEDKESITETLKQYKVITFMDIAQYIPIDKVEFSRRFCEFYHIDQMDHYFDVAENALHIFWGKDSYFFKLFQKLDLTNVIELACGRGRHVPMYIKKSGNITLVDILEKNIDFCKERFKDSEKIFYYKNNGHDLKELESNAYTALFTYDAMVHFELIDIYTYLQEIHRVLKNGGRALFHHSNNSSDYKVSFSDGMHGRSFMSKEIFAHLSDRAGFTVLEQKIIDWGEAKSLDCISLLEKR